MNSKLRCYKLIKKKSKRVSIRKKQKSKVKKVKKVRFGNVKIIYI